jgi:beta-glucosidase
LYPFGYGRSYSRFAYGRLRLSQSKLNAGDSLDIDLDVKNLSNRGGDEVVELYLSFPQQLADAPLRALRGFQRVHLGPNETRRVHLTLNSRDLSSVNEAGDRIVSHGQYIVSVGGGQPRTGVPTVQAKFIVRGEQKLPD